MLRIAICDDEKIMCDTVETAAMNFFAKVDMNADITVFNDGDKIISAYENGSVFDIILLDIKMKNVNGISAAKVIRTFDEKALIVFITSSAEYVFRGYEVKAFRYILKTELSHSFNGIMKDCVDELTNKNQAVFGFVCGTESHRVPLGEILYFESDKRRVNVKTKSGEYSFYDKLDKIESELCDKDFVRIHQSFFVNAKMIKSVGNGEVVMTDGSILPVSRAKQKSTKDAFIWAMR